MLLPAPLDSRQVAVYLAYATGAGHGVINRELYLPQGWIDDPARCRAAGVPDQVGLATKPELARRMLERALEAGGAGRLGDRRCGLRHQPGAARLAGGRQLP